MHGDSLCTRDTEHQEFRRRSQSQRWQKELLSRPLAERRPLVEQLRESSQLESGRRAEDIIDVTEREVLSAMHDHACSILIHGYTHRPARHENRAGQRWVLGDWNRSGWYLRLQDSGFELTEFVIEGEH